MSDEERAWLKDLNEELWPKKTQTGGVKFELEATRPLTFLEFKRVCDLIVMRNLVVSMFSSSMFGGYGMRVFEYDPHSRAEPVLLLRLVEDHHPDPHPLEVSENGYTKHIRRTGGVGRDDAWESFSRFTHSRRNRKLLSRYRMEPPLDRSSYDY